MSDQVGWEPYGDEWFREANQGHLEISLIPSPYVDPVPSQVWTVRCPGDGDPEQLAREVILLAQEIEYGASFLLEIKRSKSSWGADGSGWLVALQFAEHVLGGGVAAFEFSRGVRAILRRWSVSYTGDRLTLDQARTEAQRVVVGRYGGDFDDYEVTDEEQAVDDGRWTVWLVQADGVRFTVEIGLSDGLAYAKRITRHGAQ